MVKQFRSLAVAASLISLVALAPAPAAAQEARSCGARIDIIKQLAADYKEQPVAIGLGDNGALLQILASSDGSTWTMLFTLPSGVSCLIATGQHFQAAPSIKVVGRPA